MDELSITRIHCYYTQLMLLAIGAKLGIADILSEIVDIENMEVQGKDFEEVKEQICKLPIWKSETSE